MGKQPEGLVKQRRTLDRASSLTQDVTFRGWFLNHRRGWVQEVLSPRGLPWRTRFSALTDLADRMLSILQGGRGGGRGGGDDSLLKLLGEG